MKKFIISVILVSLSLLSCISCEVVNANDPAGIVTEGEISLDYLYAVIADAKEQYFAENNITVAPGFMSLEYVESLTVADVSAVFAEYRSYVNAVNTAIDSVFAGLPEGSVIQSVSAPSWMNTNVLNVEYVLLDPDASYSGTSDDLVSCLEYKFFEGYDGIVLDKKYEDYAAYDETDLGAVCVRLGLNLYYMDTATGEVSFVELFPDHEEISGMLVELNMKAGDREVIISMADQIGEDLAQKYVNEIDRYKLSK